MTLPRTHGLSSRKANGVNICRAPAFARRSAITRVMQTRWIALACLMAFTAPAFSQTGASPNDQARFLAGLPVRGSSLENYTRHDLWVEHASAMDQAWGKQEQRQLARVRAWSRSFAPEAYGSKSPAFYMFSGPDFLYANAFFPNASTYILCGTEPIGAVPDITAIPPEQLAPALASLRQSTKTILSFHYFITKEMRTDLTRSQLGGTLPILCAFLARSGHTVRDVSFLKTPAPGVRITFTGGAGGVQTLYYFKTDLSNGGGSAGFLKWCAAQGPGVSLVKAASYLMHSDSFSTVRNFLLQNSSAIVQDDSGIPLRSFDTARWNLRYFGTYTAPIELFAKNYQPDLAQAFQISHPAELGFAFGYHWQTERGMLMSATRK